MRVRVEACSSCETRAYTRLCSLQAGCCRASHTDATPDRPILFRLRSTFFTSDWPEVNAADRAPMDAAVSLQLWRLSGAENDLKNPKPTYRKTDTIPTGAPAVCSEDCRDPCTVSRNLGLRSHCVSWLKAAAERCWSSGQRPGHHSSAL